MLMNMGKLRVRTHRTRRVSCTHRRVLLLVASYAPLPNVLGEGKGVKLCVVTDHAVFPGTVKISILFEENMSSAKGKARYAPLDIAGQVVLVTGASAGIGAATATVFAELGCKVRKSKPRLVMKHKPFCISQRHTQHSLFNAPSLTTLLIATARDIFLHSSDSSSADCVRSPSPPHPFLSSLFFRFAGHHVGETRREAGKETNGELFIPPTRICDLLTGCTCSNGRHILIAYVRRAINYKAELKASILRDNEGAEVHCVTCDVSDLAAVQARYTGNNHPNSVWGSVRAGSRNRVGVARACTTVGSSAAPDCADNGYAGVGVGRLGGWVEWELDIFLQQ